MLNRLDEMKRVIVRDVLGAAAPETLPFMLLGERRKLPAVCAVYAAITPQGEALYVGATLNLRKRWRRHHQQERLETYGEVRLVWREHFPQDLAEAERALIYALDPALNRTTTLDRRDAAQRTLELDPESEWVLDCFRPQEVAHA